MFKTVQGRRIRVGLVGCGRIAKNHFGSIEAHSGDLELVAVCDNDRAALQVHQEKYSVKGYARMEDMLRNEELDVVALCT
ncbi:MAG: Gfo/Idh/MocA family oxidoreductase, partial [Candidatus Accumulibacter sp.]|nr:Gfo/Idh/MocA family oxidoreductase [Accumulibacter sp.]